jgi:hypothetical protein
MGKVVKESDAIKNIIEKCQRVKYTFIGFKDNKYIGWSTYLILKCNKHNIQWDTTCYTHFINGNRNGCPKCSHNKNNKIDNIITEIKDKCNKNNIEFISFVDGWKGSRNTYLILKCSVDGYTWNTTRHDHFKRMRKVVCPNCDSTGRRLDWNIALSKINNICKKRNYQFIEVVGEWVNNRSIIKIKCNTCQNIWETSYVNFMGGFGNCLRCNPKSGNELLISLILDNYNIKYYQNYRKFDWLKNKKNMELDFYLPEYNMAIEYQGKQHFSETSWGGKEELNNIQYRDKIKQQLCQEHNVVLFYINYDDNVEEKLNEILNIIF